MFKVAGYWQYPYRTRVVSRASQTCSIGDMSAEYAGHVRTGNNKRPLKNVQFYHTDQCKFWGSVQLACLTAISMCHMSPKAFQTIWPCIQLASQLQTTCKHTSPGPPHPACSPPRSSETSHPDSCCRLREAHLHARRPHRGLDLAAVRLRNRLEWANAHIRWRLARWRGVLLTDESRWQMAVTACVRSCGWAVCWCQRCGWSGVMVWAGVCYGQRTQVHFVDGILNAQRYRDEILRSVVVPFIHDHHLMLRHDSAPPVLQGSVHSSWKLKTSQFLHGQHTHQTCHPLSMFGMLWIRLVYDTYTTACSCSCQYPATWHSHWRGVDQHSTGHNQQPDQLYAKEMWGKWWSHQILTGFLTTLR